MIIVLWGSTALLQGFDSRLKKELVALAPSGTRIRMISAGKNAAWMGGRDLGLRLTHIGVTQSEFDSCGPAFLGYASK